MTVARHPNIEFVGGEMDEHGVEKQPHSNLEKGVQYVKPIELWRDTGQHSLSGSYCKDLKTKAGCIRNLGFTQE